MKGRKNMDKLEILKKLDELRAMIDELEEDKVESEKD